MLLPFLSSTELLRIMRKVLVFLSDMHSGHVLGLLNPTTVLQDEDQSTGEIVSYSPKLTATQEYLWVLYQLYLEEIARIAAGAPIQIYFDGDVTQGNAFHEQLVTTQLAGQLLIAAANLRPLVSLPGVQVMRFASGTGVHVFKEGSAPVLVKAQLEAEFPAIDFKVMQHGLVDIDGFLVDYAHHGPSSGIRMWTEGNQLRYYLKSLMLEEIVHGKVPPRFVFRAHFHEYVRETVRVKGKVEYEADIVLLPSWCGMGEHGRKATGSKLRLSNGLIVLVVEDGKLVDYIPLVEQVDLRTKERL